MRAQRQPEVWRWERDLKLAAPAPGEERPEAERSAAEAATSGAEKGARILARFWPKVDKSGECWLWTDVPLASGYGQFAISKGEKVRAHRFSYALAFGPIPPGLTIDHVKARGCTSRLCVNPAHLEAVTNRENVLRGDHPNAVTHRTGKCARGHSMRNAKRTPKGRECRTCIRLRENARRAAKRKAGAA